MAEISTAAFLGGEGGDLRAGVMDESRHDC